MVLEHFKVLKIVLGEEKKPVPTFSSAGGNNSSNDADIEIWVDKDQSARIAICGTAPS